MRQSTHKFEFKKKPKEISAPSPADTGPPPIVWMLAFAHRVDREISDGVFPNRVATARHYGVTRARLTQIMNLLWLAPEIQEEIVRDGRSRKISERTLRKLLPVSIWETQKKHYSKVWIDIETACKSPTGRKKSLSIGEPV